MNIQKHILDDAMINIVMTLDPADYKGKFDQKLNATASKATIKGFRKGKVPANVIRKMYGESIFVEIMDELFNKAFNDYTKEQNIKFIMQPILAEGYDKFTLDLNNTSKSYTLAYTIAELPNFDIEGIGENDEYQSFSPIIEEEVIENELKNIQKKYGKMEEASSIEGGEMLTIYTQETENGQIKENGYAKDIVILYDHIADEELKKLLTTKKIDDTFMVEVSKLEDKDLSFIKKNVLALPDEFELKEDDIFHFTIKKIMRLIPAELTEEFLKDTLKMDTVDDVKAEIRKYYGEANKPYTESLLKKEIMDKVMEKTNLDLSSSFIKKWLSSTEKMESEKIEEELPSLLKELKWTYIKNRLSEQYGIEVKYEDVRGVMFNRLENLKQTYGGYLNQDTVKMIIENWQNDKNQMYQFEEEARANKIFAELFKNIKIKENKISTKEFEDMFKVNNN